MNDDALLRRANLLHDAILRRAHAGEGEPPPVGVFAMLVCNHCGRQLIAEDSGKLAARAAVDGWSIGENLGDADLCRGCSS